MKHLFLPAGVCSAFLLLGCAGDPAKPDSEDPDFYARKIKTQVYELAQTAGRDPREAGPLGSVLLEELEVYESQPVGSHKETYARLLQKCRELVAATQGGSGGQVSAKVGEMKALADQLPGEVTLEPPEAGE